MGHRLARPNVWVILLFLSPAFSSSAAAEQPSLKLTSTRLAELSACLGNQYSQIHDLEAGLLSGWGKWRSASLSRNAQPATPPPREYMDSVDQDLAACKAAAAAKDPAVRRAILESVSDDIAIKAADCKQFGMGRNVSVQVVTLRGGNPDNGWEVFYRWRCSSALKVEERRIPQLTSPAAIDLAPGEYVFRAQKRTAAGDLIKTDPAPITVGLRQKVECQLPVP